jgi:hypothetical protein
LNEEALSTYGFSRAQLFGKPVNTIVATDRQKQFTESLARCRRGEFVQKVDDIIVGKEGAAVSRVLSLNLLTDDLGEPDAIAIRTRLARE